MTDNYTQGLHIGPTPALHARLAMTIDIGTEHKIVWSATLTDGLPSNTNHEYGTKTSHGHVLTPTLNVVDTG